MNARRPDATYIQRVSDALSIGAWNLGIGGCRMDAAHFEWALSARDWRVITVALGGNDFVVGTPIDEFRLNTEAMVGAIESAAPLARLLMITPPPIVSSKFGVGIPMEAYRETIASAATAAKEPCVLIDGSRIVDTDKDHYTPDGVHLSDNGFGVYAERLEPHIAAALGTFR
jgi:lysophospholipase L1-like esterase